MGTFRILILFFLSIITIHSYSQYFTIDKIGLENGLSDSYILCMAQDEDGFMWFGTEWGLNKYDGHTFTTYKVNSPESNTISHNGINKLLVDTAKNLIWIGTKGGGLNTFNYKSQQFFHFPLHTDEPNATKANGVTDICFDKDNNLWISTYRAGLRKLDKNTHHISWIQLQDVPLPDVYYIWCIEDDLQGNLYIGHWGNGLTILSTSDLTAKHFDYDPNNPEGLPGNEIVDICVDTRNNVWLGTHTGLAIYHPDNDKFTVFRYDKNNPNGLSNDDIHSITQIDNQIWIGTWKGGINILELENEDWTAPEKVRCRHIASGNLSTELSIPSIESIFGDSFGNIWIGTYGEGLNVISHITPYFGTLTYSKIKGDIHGLSEKSANCLTFDDDSLLYVGLNNGYVDIYRINYRNNPFYKIQTLFLDNNILCAMADGRGNIWVGRNTDGLLVDNIKKKTYKKPDFIKDDFCSEYNACMYKDRQQNLWFGSECGILKYNPHTNTIQETTGKKIGLRDDLIRQIIQDVNGNFWIGSAINGVALISPDFKIIKHFTVDDALGAQNINHIYQDSQNKIWVATKNGVTCFPSIKDQDYQSFILNTDSGLNDNFIRSVVEGKPGEIWLATNAGLSRYTEQDKKIENFDNTDGIPWGTFNSGAAIKIADGTIILGSQNGICYFDPKIDFIKQVVPPTVITKLEVYDSKAGSTFKSINIPVENSLELKHYQNTLLIEFNVMDYALNNLAEYSYILKGIDDDIWHPTNSNNQVTFRNLLPGRYTFHVRARIHNQEWSSKTDSIYFRIKPPFWHTWWAISIYILLTCLVVFAIIVFYRRRLILENQLYLEKENHIREHEINNERLQFFTNITHELKTPLTLILSPIEDLLQKDKENKKLSLIHKSAVRLNELINQLMEFRKSEAQNKQLSVRKEDISRILREIVLKYKELNNNNELSIEFFSETSVNLFLDREVLTIIMDNLISNALKNTPRGKIIVIVREIRSDNFRTMEIEVLDTGIGIPEDALDKIFNRYYQVKRENHVSGTGIGLALVKNLVKLHKATIEVKSKLYEGTSFFIRFNTNESYPEALHDESTTTAFEQERSNVQQLLVIEDNEDIRNYIADIFADSFEILSAKDGQEGLQLAMDKMPDIIISDIMMPRMDGIELCRRLKADINTSHIPVILFTAKDTDQDKTKGYLTGADSYLTKPFRSELLKIRVQNLLLGREKIAEYFSSGNYKKDVAITSLTKLDNEFINRTITIIEDNIDLEQMSVSFLADQQRMSYSSFTRKLKAITGLTVTEFVKDIKMQHAEQLLLSGKYTISEIAYQVGYSSMAYFRKAFKEKFGTSPSQYIQNLGRS